MFTFRNSEELAMTDLYVIEGQFSIHLMENTFDIVTPTINVFKMIDEKESYFNVMILGQKTRVYKDKYKDCTYFSMEEAATAIRARKANLIEKVEKLLHSLNTEAMSLPVNQQRPNSFTV